MRTRHLVAGATSVASALALIVIAPASAHEAAGVAALPYGPRISASTLIGSLVSTPLDRLDAWATSLRQKVAAVPDGTVLTGRTRLLAKRQLHAAVEANARLATLTGLTTEQQAEVADIRATLAAAAADLRALLANRPTVTAPAAVVVPTVAVKTLTTRHHCDGFRDGLGDGPGDRSWDGWRDHSRH